MCCKFYFFIVKLEQMFLYGGLYIYCRYTSKLVRYILFHKIRYISLHSIRYDINPYISCRQAHIEPQVYRIVRYIENPSGFISFGMRP